MTNPLSPPVIFSEQEKLDWLRLARTENVGPVTFYKLIEAYGSARSALEALPELSRRGGRAKPLTPPPPGLAEREYAALRKLGGEIVTAAEAGYPLALGAIDDAPPVLSVLGRMELLHKPCIALVGARNASLNGRKFAQKLAQDLGAQGHIVVSGLARGIDTAAHQGALASGTIAVVAGGIDDIYPEENAALYHAIREQGLIVAESPLGQKPFAQSFPRRNRIVSGLSKGVIVVEATMKSGSLITARLAGEQGRDVFAVPGHPLDPRAAGPNHLLREGATLIRGADDVLEIIRNFAGTGLREPLFAAPIYTPAPVENTIVRTCAPPQKSAENDGHDPQDLVLEQLSATPIQVDELIRACHLTIPEVNVIVLELELAGRIKRHPGNRISLLQAA